MAPLNSWHLRLAGHLVSRFQRTVGLGPVPSHLHPGVSKGVASRCFTLLDKITQLGDLVSRLLTSYEVGCDLSPCRFRWRFWIKEPPMTRFPVLYIYMHGNGVCFWFINLGFTSSDNKPSAGPLHHGDAAAGEILQQVPTAMDWAGNAWENPT